MSFYFSKSKFVSNCQRCNKFSWLEKNKPEEKAPVGEFLQSIFDNGHLVGELAKERYKVDVDVTAFKENGALDIAQMIENTKEHLKLGTKLIAEASFSADGFYCAVDILKRNDDGSYNIYEVKSSKHKKPTKKNPSGVHDKYKQDAAYQRYVLEQEGIKIDKVYVVMLSNTYVRGVELELDKYFVELDVTDETAALRPFVVDRLKDIGEVLCKKEEPDTVFTENCKNCDFWGYCSKNVPTPSPFDVYNMHFKNKCQYYNDGVSFFDLPTKADKLDTVAKLQIEYFNRPDDAHIDKGEIKNFLDGLSYPVYSLDFETYTATVPEYEGMKTSEAVPFQYSLHIIKKPNPDISEGSNDIEEHGFLDISGADTRRAIAESLVKDIPYGATVVAFHKGTEAGIIGHLAKLYPDLSDHLLSFEYFDPLNVFQNGYYYIKAIGGSCSLKSIAPALYPFDKDMDYKNLEGNIKNGSQAMSVFSKINDFSEEEKQQTEEDLRKYCALDTFAVVKILKKLYEVIE